MKHLTENEITKIIYLYENEHKSTQFIGKLYGRTPQTINNILKTNNIQIRTRSEAQIERNENSKIPKSLSLFPISENIAFFIGQVYGDGSLHKNGLSVSVSSGDQDNLDNINYIFNNACTISKNDKNKTMVITICKKHIVDELKHNFGLMNNKSDLLSFPTIINDKLMPFFISGYLASDGCIRVRKRGNSKLLTIQFTSCSKLFLEDLSKYFSKILNLKIRKLYLKNKNRRSFGKKDCYDLTYYGRDAIQLCEWIFNKTTSRNRCERKYLIYNKYKEETLNTDIDIQRPSVYDKYDWNAIAQQFLDLRNEE